MAKRGHPKTVMIYKTVKIYKVAMAFILTFNIYFKA